MKAKNITARKIGKRFGATVALSDVTIEFRPGAVHALMGANGSGKSTLSKILAGVLTPDTGQIELSGTPMTGSPKARAAGAGIAAVFQETSLIPDMAVQDNIWLGHEPLAAFGVDTARMRHETLRLLDLLGGIAEAIRPETPVRSLGPAERQLVELLKAVSRDPAMIILDEATASLDTRQAARVAELARVWRSEGRIVVLITHRMPEVFALADTLSVLRNGVLVGTRAAGETDEAEIVDLMVGAKARRIEQDHRARKPIEQPGLRATVDLASPSKPFEISVRPGEIVGLAGLQGQGQSQVLRRLFEGGSGLRDISIAGKETRISQPHDAVDAGLALVPGDRNTDGLFRTLSVFDNVMSASWSRFRRKCVSACNFDPSGGVIGAQF